MSVRADSRPLWLSIVCITALVASGCGGAESRKARHLEKGQRFLVAGNFEKARVEFRNALQIAPTDSVARYENGVVDEKLGNMREAAQFYQGAIDVDKDNVAARAALGRIYTFAGAPGKALDTINPSLAKHPDNAALLTVRAAARVQLKQPAEALADAERAVQLAPTSEDAVAVLAGIYKANGDIDKAIALLQNAIRQIPATVDLRLVLAQLYAGAGQEAQTEALLVDLVRLNPTLKAHRLRLAQFYARLNKLDDAERILREGVKAIPQDRDLKTGLIDFLAARRSREIAGKELNSFIAQDPKDYQLRFALAQFYEQGKDVAKAEAVYKDVIAAAGLDGPGITARDRLAAMRILQDDVPGAEKLIAEVLAKVPRDDDALILHGDLALAQKDPKTAIADLRSVLRDQPNAVGVMRALARAHLANGEPALAEETMRRAVEAIPNDSGARLDLAQLLIQLGKPEQAKPVVDELVKQQPNNIDALVAQFKIAAANKDLVSARAAADAIVATNPKLGVGYYCQGATAETDKHFDDAIRLYSKALEIQPEAAEPLQNLVRVLVGQNRVPEALKRLDAVAARFPQSAFAPNLKGEVLLSQKRIPDAIAAFRMAIEREPKYWPLYRNLAFAQSFDHDNDHAIVTLQSGIGMAASPEPLETELALLYERIGKPDDAIELYEAALRRNPNSDVLANNLAMLLVNHRKDEASLDRAKLLSARFSASANASYLDTYGWVLYRRGDAAAAVAALQSALSKTPDSPVSLYHLGMAQALAGQADAARDSLSRSLKSGKNFSGMDEAKATLDKLANQAPASAALPKS
ncbi:MAG: tetratricopeptide repeat protein [Steroidobacteraceae bacterium]